MSEQRVPQILFVCVQNAGRSQMAAAFAERLGGDGLKVRSAGTAPADDVHPEVVKVMAEKDIDLASVVPRVLDRDEVAASDVVVTMGCGDACPVFPGKRYEDWDLEDPAGKDLERVRAIRDDIERRVRELIDSLVSEPSA